MWLEGAMNNRIKLFVNALLSHVSDYLVGQLKEVLKEISVYFMHPVKVLIALGIFIIAPLRNEVDFSDFTHPNFVWIVLILVVAGMFNRFGDIMDRRN